MDIDYGNVESEFLSISSLSIHFLFIFSFSLHFLFIFSFSLHFFFIFSFSHPVCPAATSCATLSSSSSSSPLCNIDDHHIIILVEACSTAVEVPFCRTGGDYVSCTQFLSQKYKCLDSYPCSGLIIGEHRCENNVDRIYGWSQYFDL